MANALDDPTPNLVALATLAAHSSYPGSGIVFVQWLRAVAYVEEAMQTMQHQTSTFQRGVAFESAGSFVDFKGDVHPMSKLPQPGSGGAKSSIITSDEVFFQPAGGGSDERKGYVHRVDPGSNSVDASLGTVDGSGSTAYNVRYTMNRTTYYRMQDGKLGGVTDTFQS